MARFCNDCDNLLGPGRKCVSKGCKNYNAVACAIARAGGRATVCRQVGRSEMTIAKWLSRARVIWADDALKLHQLSGVAMEALAGAGHG